MKNLLPQRLANTSYFSRSSFCCDVMHVGFYMANSCFTAFHWYAGVSPAAAASETLAYRFAVAKVLIIGVMAK